MTEPTQDLAARRREIVRAVAYLSEKHNLPMPSISFEPKYDQIELHLDRNLAEAVTRWTDLLGNGPVSREALGPRKNGFVSVGSDKHPHDGPTWLNAGRVQVNSYCDLPPRCVASKHVPEPDATCRVCGAADVRAAS